MEQSNKNAAPSRRLCWICRTRTATTREHRIKRSDLTRFYKAKNFAGDARPYHFRGEKISRLQSHDAEAVKYDKNLCEECNSAKSQPFDRAYEQFVDWMLGNEDEIFASHAVDFPSVYGSRDFEVQQLNLFKYFAKCFGCRLDEAQRAVPDDVRALLDQRRFRTGLCITFSIQPAMEVEGESVSLLNSLGTFPLLEFPLWDNEEKILGYSCGQHVSWLAIHFWYCIEPPNELGEIWVADRDRVRLGKSPITSTL